jgi:hypothetical protein
MRAPKLLLVLIAAALAAVLAPSALAAPPERGLSAYGYDGGVVGMVEIGAPGRCATGREVEVFKRVGEPGAADDELVGRAKAKLQDGVYLWSLRTGRGGDLYAEAAAEPGCGALADYRVAAAPGDEGPICNPFATAGFCLLATKEERMDFVSDSCRAFRLKPGSCSSGDSSGAEWPWSGNLTAEFGWEGWYNDTYRLLYTTHRGSDNTGISHLSGTLPGTGSDAFTVEDGYAQRGQNYGEGPHFFTPNLPGTKPGQEGGPINFDFEAGCSLFCRDHIYFYGWLLVK